MCEFVLLYVQSRHIIKDLEKTIKATLNASSLFPLEQGDIPNCGLFTATKNWSAIGLITAKINNNKDIHEGLKQENNRQTDIHPHIHENMN